MDRLTTIILRRIIITIISKILSPPEISGSHSSPRKISLPVPLPDLALVSPSCLCGEGINPPPSPPTPHTPTPTPGLKCASSCATCWGDSDGPGRQLACWIRGEPEAPGSPSLVQSVLSQPSSRSEERSEDALSLKSSHPPTLGGRGCMMDHTASPFFPLLWQSLEKPVPLWAHFSLILEGFLPPWEGEGWQRAQPQGAEQGACLLSGQECLLGTVFFGGTLSFSLHCIKDRGGRVQMRKLRLRQDCVQSPALICHVTRCSFHARGSLCKPKYANMAQAAPPGGL